MQLFSYVVARDFGFAPNPFHGVCTLATCKKDIRKAAKIGDWIIGTGSKSYKPRNIQGALLFCMRVDRIIPFDDYWSDEEFLCKRPVLQGSRKHQMGDNIYHRESGGWVQEHSHHSCADGSCNPNNLDDDTGTTDQVLIGYRFAYWGSEAIPIPDQFRNWDGHDIVIRGQKHKSSSFPPKLVEAFVAWFEGLNLEGIQGEPCEFVARNASKWPIHV